jgi:hypothetical protein
MILSLHLCFYGNMVQTIIILCSNRGFRTKKYVIHAFDMNQ